ncbi:multiple PDZ domain protein-like isoform X3 [Rhodnius prolixus]|uniref:multiple PDZ domain protein-like isoform X3 n=1 Tax=Rhodnius prolixus TaxID=13249 RepID=UPI003D188EC2
MQITMPLNSDISSALHLLEHIHSVILQSDDTKLQSQTNSEFKFLITLLENPIFRNIVNIQDSVRELSRQLQEHPSIVPVDFDIRPNGELILNIPPPIFEVDEYISPTGTIEIDDQRVPVAKLSNSSSGGTNSPPIISPNIEDASLPPITTSTYALEFQKAIEESSHGREVLTVKLFKPEGCSLGFSVVGLRSEEKGELGIFIQEIQANGIAGRDGHLHEGDQILAIDGQPLDSNISHQQAISILQKARGLVELIVARTDEPPENRQVDLLTANSPSPTSPSPEPLLVLTDTSANLATDMVLNTEWAQVEVIDLINDGSGLGFGIIGGRSTGVVVKTILPGGVADRDGRLQSGDHILQIGDVNLRGMGSEQVAAVLRQSGSRVRLVVARPVEPTSPDYQSLDSHAPVVPTKILADPDQLDRHLVQNGYPQATPYPENPFIYHDSSDIHIIERDPRLVVDVVPSLPLPLLTMDMLPLDSHLPETERFTVELKKDVHGLGITIAGYVCEKEELSGIFVKSISVGSAADLCNKIQVNDRIVEVDGTSLQGYTNHDAVEVLKATGSVVRLSLERYLRGPKFEQLQQAIANSELKPPTPSSPSAFSLPRYPISADGESTTEIEIEGESVTTVDSVVLHEATNVDVLGPTEEASCEDSVDYLIDTDYEGPLSASTEQAIKEKWYNILGPDVEIVVGQLKKFGEGGGLGISLEGTVDVEDGQEVRPHHYIRSILAEGPVGQNGKLKSGDELLEVNGHRLLGMNHIEVVTILKELPMAVRMVCARRNGDGNALRLIDTSQDRAAFAARSILGGSLQNLIPAMERLVKAKSDGSLASTATTAVTEPSLSKLRSRSLEPITGLAMWSSEPHIIELVKGERGLGFSILDYQDPMNSNETVIVIRSLVPGGVAQTDGRLIPGDRLLSVNSVNLEHASLDQAVQALKGAPRGVVTIAVAKPLPIPDSVSQELDTGLRQDTPTLDDNSMYSCSGSLQSDIEFSPEILQLDEQFAEDNPDRDSAELFLFKIDKRLEELEEPDARIVELEDEDEVENNFEEDLAEVCLPQALEVEIKIRKGSEPLGLSVESLKEAVNGATVTSITPGSVIYQDGRVSLGDYITSINNESLRRTTHAQVSCIIARAQLVSTDISIRFISKRGAVDYLRTCPSNEVSLQPKTISLPSPRIFPNYYRSPYIRPAGVQSPPGWESASDKESEYVDCDPLLTTCLSTSSEQVDPDRDQLTGQPDLTIEPSPAEGDSDDQLEDIDESVNCVQPSLTRERSLESLKSVRTICEQTQANVLLNNNKLYKGISEPILNSDLGKNCSELIVTETLRTGSSFLSRRKMTVTNSSCTVLLSKHWGPQRTVSITRLPNTSLGISIVGGKVDLYNAGPDSCSAISGIFIKNVLADSPAGITGQLKTGDRILEVDGIDLRQASHEYAVDIIRAAGNPVVFLVQSLVQWNVEGDSVSAGNSARDVSAHVWKSASLSEVERPIVTTTLPQKLTSSQSNNVEAPKEQSSQHYSPSSSEESEDEFTDLESKIRTAAGIEISRASAGNVRLSKQEIASDQEQEDQFGYTTNKVRKKYGSQGVAVVVAELNVERGAAGGLGISLAGHKDRTKMAVLIAGLNPAGRAYSSGQLQVGDEILEVNGVILQGRCHLNASAIIKGLPGPLFKIIALRKAGALDELSVKPITQFPLSLREETAEQRYASFKGLRTISIKKSGQGLGIMIIEGKHAEVGQGIFISDIQEGSAAHQAGLSVGDMILSVNRDSLLGSNYDTAAALLKKTEGMVTLVVCNPNRARDEDRMGSSTSSPDSASRTQSVQLANKSATSTPKLMAAPATLSPSPSGKVKVEVDGQPELSAGQQCLLEVNKDKLALGISLVGGADTPLGTIVVHEVHAGGAIAKDGRLRTGDHILEVNGESFKAITYDRAIATLRQTPSKVHLTVYRPELTTEGTPHLSTFEVDLMRKAGKGLGLSVAGLVSGKGIFISDILAGSVASMDGRLTRGDRILSINGTDVTNMAHYEAAAILKTQTGKVTLKLGRYQAR